MTAAPEPARWADAPAMLLAGLRAHHAFATARETVPAQWRAFAATRHALPAATVAYGAMCGTDLAAGTYEYLCGVAVPSFDLVPPGVGRMRVPAAHYAVFEHRGPVARLHDTWEAIWRRWVPAMGDRLAPSPDFERYAPGVDPVHGDGLVEIWVPVVTS